MWKIHESRKKVNIYIHAHTHIATAVSIWFISFESLKIQVLLNVSFSVMHSHCRTSLKTSMYTKENQKSLQSHLQKITTYDFQSKVESYYLHLYV